LSSLQLLTKPGSGIWPIPEGVALPVLVDFAKEMRALRSTLVGQCALIFRKNRVRQDGIDVQSDVAC
jgi:hypothetical protein